MFATGFLGIATLIVIAVLASINRKAINLRTVGGALALQIGIGAFVLYIPAGRAILHAMSKGVSGVIDSGRSGVNFLFGNLTNGTLSETVGFVFAFNVLCLVIFFSALIAVLYHLGVMQVVIRVVGGGLAKLLGTHQAESMSAVSNVFVGQTEAPLVVKPYMPKMSDSEFFAIMCGGMASVAGTVLGGYALMGVKIEFLLAASFMAAPGGLLFAKLIMPETKEVNYTVDTSADFGDEKPENVLAAAGQGAMNGLQLAGAIGANLVAMIGLITLVNLILGGVGDLAGFSLSLEMILGWIFAPIAYLLGVPMADIGVAGSLIGKKLVVNEFVAYLDLKNYLVDATAMDMGLPIIQEKTKAIVSFALCGFANISSMGILIGGLGVLAPNRMNFIAKYGPRTLLAATCSNLMSAAIAGIFISLAM
ncbi:MULTISPECIES: NupC/NupG family nucleoside CNT transporter [unclassified Pseudovibrio]|uniref:NupC/NupG family nucleoside CNT transporter n=1 Tax=unclassified Pseudovibrio TaxID=2627060 RepID=UPI0007AEC824|nr:MULTISPECIES: NupC/NupG family nucleoside CNT transporter [unclassified Pseudovibrio]KZL24565.1 Nucleoside permease NupX [Pseudovibrio sp. WM33]KZL28484.1 Nucleoside permease NupX [Pseudovibrio sp. Ad37]